MTFIILVSLLISSFLVVATSAQEDGGAASTRSGVDFGVCKELAVGSVTPLSKLQDLVPANVKVLSMTEQGFVFPGSDDLGNLLIRSLECDYIQVDGKQNSEGGPKKHISHIGTPFDTSSFPASPFAADGTTNGADFNNYVFAYLTDSEEYYDAMVRANIVGAGLATISHEDSSPSECQLERTVVVEDLSGGGYGYTAVATAFPDPACAPQDTPYIANWWSVEDGHNDQVSILSNVIPGQAAVFFDLSVTTISLDAMGDGLKNLFGGDNTTADSFGLGGYLPEVVDSPDMIIDQVGGGIATEVVLGDDDLIMLCAQTRAGSYWLAYPTADDVPDGWLVEPGTKVDDSCCTSDTEQTLRADFTSNTCEIFRGFLPSDATLGLVHYLGCENGMEVYGEACYDGGENGGIVPADVMFEGSNVGSIEDCGTNGGCTFEVRGDGCWKVRNTNDLPGCSDDPVETFLWMNEPSCSEASVGDIVDDVPGSGLDSASDESDDGSASAASATTMFVKLGWMASMIAVAII